jgi:hypothetical protein
MLPSIRELREIASTFPVVRACIELRKQEVASAEWDIIPATQAAESLHGDYKASQDFAARRREAVRFFRQPEPNYGSFHAWAGRLLDEVLVTATCPLYLPYNPTNGLLGSNVAEIALLDADRLIPPPARVFPAGPLVLALRRDDDGKLDKDATEKAAPKEFGIPYEALGIERSEEDGTLRPLGSELRAWLKGVADWVLQEKCGACDLEWAWLPD